MRVLVYGSCNIDLAYAVDHTVRPGETIAASGVTEGAGGKGLNQAISLARAGADVSFAGAIGSDGGFLRDLLAENGVDTSRLLTVPGRSGTAIIQVASSGQNSIIVHHGANYAVTEERVDAALSDFGQGDAIVLQNEINMTGFILARAKERGMFTVLNPSPIDDDVLSLDLSLVDFIFVNETESAAFAAKLGGRGDEPTEFIGLAAERYPELEGVVTLGPDGCVWFRGGERVASPAADAKVVDTTCAGDTFTGYCLQARSEGLSPEEFLRIANAASGIAISRPGAAASIPYKHEVR